jgi:RNA polymerase-binding transcription factor DksA
MAIQKKKATPVAQKSKAKKVAAKPVATKKIASKKVAPAKKVAPVKKAAVSSKKPVTKKAAPAKPVAKKAVVKKAAPEKKVAAVKKAEPVKKAVSKLNTSKKSSKPIIKTSPVKNAAKAGLNKAVIKKLATPKKESTTKAVAIKKTPEVTKTAKAKSEEKVSVQKNTTNHKEELKKALSKVKTKSKESVRTEKPFVMPKTNTEKSRKYEPEFTKSVLDQSPEEYSGPTMRYSDNELVEFRELITRKLETAKKELGYLQGLITRKDQMGGDDADNRYMTMEDGSLSMEREQLSQMASRQITFIDHLEKAMMRIENKTYGICRVTGKLIDKARLRAVPHATLSIEAKMGIAR